MVFAPTDAPAPLLIPDHPYLFKTAYGWRSFQMWSEFIAYRIAKLTELPVPPCLVGFDSASGEAGALVEFFYGYPGEDRPARLIHAADIISGIHRGLHGGRPHNVLENLRIGRLLLQGPDAIAWWAKVVVFDALLGNSDRHTENWGFLVRRDPAGGYPHYELAPIFDNATSLGYEWPEAALLGLSKNAALAKYIGKGRSHLGWDMRSDVPTDHLVLIERFLNHSAAHKPILHSVLQFSMLQIATILQECTQFKIAVPLSARRADFIYMLVKARKQMIEKLLGF